MIMKKRKIISPQMAAYNKVALIMAYNEGATDEIQARQMADKYLLVDIKKYTEEFLRKEMK